jgi:hypothetical protein
MSDFFETIKQQFRDIDCRVTDFSDTHFEIVHAQFPAATLINPTPYYLEYTTILWARPGGYLQRLRFIRDGFLNEANQMAHLVKFTCDYRKIDREAGGWEIQALARMVPGTFAEEYNTDAIKNWTHLWLQDLAKVVLLEGNFEIIAMMKKNQN